MYAGGGAAAVAAAKRRIQHEEEVMTKYNREDLEGWEFKIVRANTRKFKTAEAVNSLCAEEAKAGWELVEKFSDCRIRFKRRVEKRADDAYLDINPYRTHIGISEGGLKMVILSILFGLILFGVLVGMLIRFKP